MNLKITSTEGILYGLNDIVRFEIQQDTVIAIMPFDAENIEVYQNSEPSNVKSVYECFQNLLEMY